ncbi:MAG: hypothetical protein WCY59_07930 [Anaerovoracaceae bacterium]
MGWTGIDVDTSWQDLTIAQEIATAYNKRVAALSETERTAVGVEEITPAETMTVFDFVYTVQTGIEAMATKWSDKTFTLVGQTVYPSSFATVAAMMTSAGLTESGYWRRIAEAGTPPAAWTNYAEAGWSYGKITDKDLAGPWLFIDLETALSELTRRVYSLGVASVSGGGAYHTDEDCGASPTLPGITYDSYPSVGIYSVMRFVQWRQTPPDYYAIHLVALYGEWTLSNLSSHNKTVTLLGIPTVEFLYDSPYWDIGLGTGWIFNSATVVLDSKTTTDTTVSCRDIPALTAWSTISSKIPWPEVSSGDTDATNSEDVYANAGCIVVDYSFEP